MNEFVKELKNLKKVSFHPNIISFFGISKEPSSNKYAMVLEFANQGNLREYLAIHFNNLQWSDKIQMALDIVCGLKCLHFKHMIHRDLHAKNILVNNNRLMIADFGASKQLTEATSNSTNSTNSTADGIGMIEYMEPQRFEENPIEGTPLRYQQLYQECWDNDPNLRPDIEGVYDILTKLKNDDFPDIPSIVLQPQPDSQSSINEFFDSKQSKLMIPRSSSTTIETSGKEEFRNLLIVGYASSGKSTLSNVLCDTDEFEESECSARNIRNFQKKIFKWNGTTYRLIDIGFSSIKKILCNKTEILQLIPEGISQVLFVVDGRFKEKEIETFEFFEKTIFESGIIEYTTIVRTKFCNFKNKNKCEEDKKQMCEESKTIAKIVESCSIIHVDNPPTNIIVNDDDDRERIVYNKKLRERSRTLLLSHLGFVCQNKYYGHNNVFKYSKLVIDLIPYLEKKEKEMKRISTPIPDELEGKKIRNLLVFGYSGSGKSTLTNVLNDTGRLEGNKQIRKTKNFQIRVFKRNETEYRIVDTIGIGDINLTKKQVISEKVAEVIYLLPEGISQVLFVIDGKFSAEKASTFNLLRDYIFESGIAEYITIVRTKFSNFKNEDECIKDKENLCDENESIAKLCKSIVYVDNPPVDISVRDDDDKETIRINKRRRNHSREILLDHLDNVCGKKYYKLKIWDNLHNKTFVRNIAEEVERNLSSEIPSLYHFEEAESYSKPVQEDLPSPRIDDLTSSQETIGKLIIVGRTNSGKSTLAKVLDSKKGTKYLVVDAGVTKLTKSIVKFSDGMCQFLFVIDGKFTAEEVKAIFDSGIYENITIVRTKFSNFKNEDECNKDKEELYKEIRSLHKESRIVAKICRSIVYVDNPPINISVVDEDDRKTNEINKKKRGRSRSILLEHLDKIFQEKYYELKAWLCNKTSIGNIGKVEQNLKLEIPTLNLSYFEEAERSFKEKISSNITKNLGHNSNVCIKKYLKEWIEERIIEDIDYFNYNEFSKIENFVRRAHETLKKANWENKKIPVVLKNLSNPQISENDFKEFITKLKTFHKNYPNVNRFFGLTRDSNGNYFSVLEYVNGRNLRDYLKSKFEIIHGNLHASQLEKQSDIYEKLNTQVIDGKSSSSALDNDRLFDKEMFNRSSSLEILKTLPQQIIRQFKLNHGLVLNGYDIMPSIQGVAVEDGELKLNLYKGQPLVYTCINSEENDLKIDTCINFPVAEIIYNGDLLESFIEKNVDDEKTSRDLYGDFFARRVLTGGQLFIIDFNSATPTQIDTLKFYLYCVYNSAKYPTDFQFSSLFTLNTLPKLITLDGEKLNTHEELTSWMNNLYQKKMVNIISYDELIPISRSERDTSLVNGDETFKEIQPGVANFEEKLSLEEWVGDVTNDNLISWTKDFNLFRGFIINKNDEMLISKKIPVDFIEIPKITQSNKSYLKIIKPSTKLEFTLVSNNIFSIKNLSTLPFIEDNDNNHKGYNHVLVKCEKYEILLNTDNIKPTKEFEQAIEEAFDSMKPLKALQSVFNEYGHLFPQRIILGRSLKNILPNLSSSNTFHVINDDDKILKLIDSLNISSLLTQKGRIIEKNNLHNWIRNTNNHLEIIEFDNIVPLYKILKTEHQEKIDDISKNNYRIIMTGITDLTDLKNNNIENYKRINIGLSLESEDYEVFGLIITENNTKSEEIFVNFGLYDFNGFYAIIKKSEETIADITKCCVLWVIIGNPSKLSVFSPKNRGIQVNYIKETVTLQLDNSNYHKKIPFQGYEGHLFSVHAYCPHKPNINVQIIKPTCNDSISNTSIGSNGQKNHRDSRDSRDSLIDAVEVELRICVMSTNYKNLKIDHTKGKKEVEYPLDTSITTEVVNDFSPLVII
ncbi:unnamed protein product [Rhizophagus irregularis]|nr:unnamed protein product [Rhizophagus irregularis]